MTVLNVLTLIIKETTKQGNSCYNVNYTEIVTVNFLKIATDMKSQIPIRIQEI